MGTVKKSLESLAFHCIPMLECERVCAEMKPVTAGEPLTFDANNGVLVVYDETGWPWIRRNYLSDVEKREFDSLVNTASLKRGAYVPHSNDGGKHIQRLTARSTY